jgi:hypothetical protein
VTGRSCMLSVALMGSRLKAQEAESLNCDFQQLMGARFPSQGS